MKSIEIEIENEKQKKKKNIQVTKVVRSLVDDLQTTTIKLSNGYKNPFIIKHTHTDSYRKHIYNKKEKNNVFSFWFPHN